jgi:hypothetical protein
LPVLFGDLMRIVGFAFECEVASRAELLIQWPENAKARKFTCRVFKRRHEVVKKDWPRRIRMIGGKILSFRDGHGVDVFRDRLRDKTLGAQFGPIHGQPR